MPPPKMHRLQQVLLSLHVRNKECPGKKKMAQNNKEKFWLLQYSSYIQRTDSYAMCITCRYLINSQLSDTDSTEHVERPVGWSEV